MGSGGWEEEEEWNHEKRNSMLRNTGGKSTGGRSLGAGAQRAGLWATLAAELGKRAGAFHPGGL